MTPRWTLADANADAARRATLPRPGAGPSEVRAAAVEYARQRFDAAAAIAEANARRAGGAKRAKAARAGRVARRAGDSDEAAILRAAVAAGWALRKMPTPVKRVGGGAGAGKFTAVYCADAGCDFRGVMPGGRAVVLEAKGASTPSLPLERHGKSTLTARQVDELAEAHALGAVAGVLVRVRPASGDVWVWCSWPAWCEASRRAVDGDRSSLSVSALLDAGAVECEGGVAGWPMAACGGNHGRDG